MPNKIIDTDFLTATMRIRALEKSLLARDRMERMLEAKTEEDAVKVLVDCGYEDFSPLTAQSLEKALANEREKTYSLIVRLVPDNSLLDVFRVRYDYHNAKALVKSEAMGETADHLLVESGRIPVKRLCEIYRSLNFSSLPRIMGDSVANAREVLARTGDPQKSDFLLDGDCLKEMSLCAVQSGSEFLKGYVRLFIDSANLRSVARAARIGKGPDFLRLILCDGGNVSVTRISGMIMSGGSPEEVFSDELANAAALGAVAMRGEGSLTAFEKACDDALVKYLQKCRYVAFGEQPLVAYLAAKESEMTIIRTILAGRLAGVNVDSIRERLREAYV